MVRFLWFKRDFRKGAVVVDFKRFFKSNGFKLFSACCFIAVGISILSFVPGANFVSEVVDYIVTPMQMVLNNFSNVATSVLPKTQKSADEYEKEIKDLKTELVRMRTILTDYYEVKRENAQYLKFYGFKKQNKSLKFKTAEVISRDPNDLFYGFTLDKGSSDGICENDPVITENGLLGRVSVVKKHSCRVKTILSPGYKMGAIDSVTGDSGVVTGKKSLADGNKTALMYISAQNKIKSGDIIVTTGLGGICPKGLPLGSVVEIKNDDYDSSFYAVIEPFDDIKSIVDVFILTDFSGKGDIAAELLPSKVADR